MSRVQVPSLTPTTMSPWPAETRARGSFVPCFATSLGPAWGHIPLAAGFQQQVADGRWQSTKTSLSADRPAKLLDRQVMVASARPHRRNQRHQQVPRSIAKWRSKRHNGAMPSVQIKDVPEQTHAVLRQRAAAAHQSLQEYLRAKLIQEASAPTVEEVLDRAGGRAGGRVPIKTATQILREDRDRR